MIYRIAQLLPEIPAPEIFVHKDESHKVTHVEQKERFMITKEDGVFIITGKEIEKHVKMTLFESEEGVYRFQTILKTMGVDDALRSEGIQAGDKVKIAEVEFDWED